MLELILEDLVKWARSAIFGVFAIAFVACAGASVAPQTSNLVPVNNSRPSTVYVYNFAVTAQEVTLNQGFLQKTFRDVTDENQQQSQRR